MDKTAIKNFATSARRKLIENVSQKAYGLGITKDEIKEIENYEDGFRVGERLYNKEQKKQYHKLVTKIREKGFEQVIEEVAYTWFNRLIAIRFMEVNNYLPIGIRVLSSEQEGKTEPDVITEVTTISDELDLDLDVVYHLQDENNSQDLFKYVLIKQCNKLNEILPYMFEKIEDYTELLLPDYLLQEGSIVYDLVTMVPDEDWKEQVEIIGWLYQYYISEKKLEVDKAVENGTKVSKEMLPAKTQLFTPDWIVKYMVENSLGRLWLDEYPNEEIKEKWKYYLEEAEQKQENLEALSTKMLNPEEIKVLDPCMGSGHILLYAFDVLYQIYKEAGYSERDIPKLIIEKNLYGLDIDDRAVQLAYFSIMMKARAYSRRIFRYKVEANLISFQESINISRDTINFFINNENIENKSDIFQESLEYLIDVFKESKQYGSMLKLTKIEINLLEKKLNEMNERADFSDIFSLEHLDSLIEKLPLLLKQYKVLGNKYDVVVTNPPYLGIKNMNTQMVEFLKENYPDSKNDLFAVYMEVCLKLLKQNGYCSLLNPHSWMFNSKYEKLRAKLINNATFINMTHFGRGVFGSDHGTTAFVLKNKHLPSYIGLYKKLFNKQGQVDNLEKKEMYFFSSNNTFEYEQNKYNFIPNKIISYWASERETELLINEKKLEDYAIPKQGMATADNKRFVRKWYEVNYHKIGLKVSNSKEALQSKKKWFPYNNGGDYRKWYGNNIDIVNWENDGEEIKSHIINRYPYLNGNYSFVIKNEGKYFNEGLTWTAISSSKFAVRYFDKGFLFSNAGMAVFEEELPVFLLAAFLNSKIVKQFLDILSPTMNYNQGDIKKIPISYKEIYKDKLIESAKKCIAIAKDDWDNYEISWEYISHPLLKNRFNTKLIKDAFNNWEAINNNSIIEMKHAENTINEILLKTYNLENHLDEKNDIEITLQNVSLSNDIKNFISYSVGCMLGRYSLDQEGLVYAGGEFDENKYETFKVDVDNVISITDDEYFDDDIVSRFVDFVRITFSEEALEENLDFIAEALDRKDSETARQTIRRYFLKDFYKDHVQTYQKRPIYWLFDSGKQNGFKALIYMHRYDESTVAKIRTDYLHTLQRKYEAEIKRQELIVDSDGSSRDKTISKKKIEKLRKQLIECSEYDQVIAHVANQRISIDLDNGVKVNYNKFQEIEVPQGEGKKPLKANILSPIKL